MGRVMRSPVQADLVCAHEQVEPLRAQENLLRDVHPLRVGLVDIREVGEDHQDEALGPRVGEVELEGPVGGLVRDELDLAETSLRLESPLPDGGERALPLQTVAHPPPEPRLVEVSKLLGFRGLQPEEGHLEDVRATVVVEVDPLRVRIEPDLVPLGDARGSPGAGEGIPDGVVDAAACSRKANRRQRRRARKSCPGTLPSTARLGPNSGLPSGIPAPTTPTSHACPSLLWSPPGERGRQSANPRNRPAAPPPGVAPATCVPRRTGGGRGRRHSRFPGGLLYGASLGKGVGGHKGGVDPPPLQRRSRLAMATSNLSRVRWRARFSCSRSSRRRERRWARAARATKRFWTIGRPSLPSFRRISSTRAVTRTSSRRFTRPSDLLMAGVTSPSSPVGEGGRGRPVETAGWRREDSIKPGSGDPEMNGELRREWSLRDLVLFHVTAVVSVRWISLAAARGPSSLSLWGLSFLVFFLP